MKLIVAVDNCWGIGYQGNLLVRVQQDLLNFRNMTTNKVVVYGSNTLLTFPHQKPLVNRVNIIMHPDVGFHVEGACVAHSLEELFEILQEYDSEEVFVVGGASIYRQLLEYCDTAYVTKFHKSYDKDVYFPDLDKNPAWELVDVSEEYVSNSDTDSDAGLKFNFCTYRKVKT